MVNSIITTINILESYQELISLCIGNINQFCSSPPSSFGVLT